MNLECIIFDMDGVLVFSEPVHYQAWVQVLSDLGLPSSLLSPTDIIGIDDATVARQVIAATEIKQSENKLVKLKQKAFIGKVPEGFPVPDGRDYFLAYYHQKVVMAVVSSSGRKEVEKILTSEKIIDFFLFYHGGEDTSSHKPEPEPYQNALTRIDKMPQNTLVIEDSEAGVQSALAAGCHVFTMQSPEVAGKYNLKNFDDYHQMLEFLT